MEHFWIFSAKSLNLHISKFWTSGSILGYILKVTYIWSKVPYIIFMLLEGLSGQVGLVLLWWNFSVVFRRLKFKIWFWGVLHQNVLPGKTYKNIWWSWENIGGLYLQLVENNIHSFNLFLYCTCKPGLGVKNHILKISQKYVIFNMTFLCLFRIFYDLWFNFETSHIICHQSLTQPTESFSTSLNSFASYAWRHILILDGKKQLEWASGISSNQWEQVQKTWSLCKPNYMYFQENYKVWHQCPCAPCPKSGAFIFQYLRHCLWPIHSPQSIFLCTK